MVAIDVRRKRRREPDGEGREEFDIVVPGEGLDAAFEMLRESLADGKRDRCIARCPGRRGDDKLTTSERE